jgi:hypothetical protein
MLAYRTRRIVRAILLISLFTLSAHGEEQHRREAPATWMRTYTGVHNPGTDTSTLRGKVMCGYQGWFAAEEDGSGRGWVHFGHHDRFGPGHCTIDLWPDMSEMDSDEKYPTPFRHKDGRTAYVFSSYNRKTVLRHFRWMQEHGIDGVFLQRFASSVRKPNATHHHRNVVTAHVQAGANQYGRTWAMMYDLSGLRVGEIEKVVIEDWKRLVDVLKITEDPSYLHHNGKPVVAVWGVGFGDNRKYTLDECERLVKFLKSDNSYGGNTVMLGVPAFWRTLNRDALHDKALHGIISQADIISPWTVGRYRSPKEARNHAQSVIRADMEWTKRRNLDNLPVVFPGFSWQNLSKARGRHAELNQIPRLKGQFLWSQATAFKQAGAEMLYVAMFDEIDEGTAIFKCTNDPPNGESKFVTYEGMESDYYLWLTGKIGDLLRGKSEAWWELPNRTEKNTGKP